MKRWFALLLLAATLGGCVVVPVERGPRAYVGRPPVVVSPYHHHHHDYDGGYRRW